MHGSLLDCTFWLPPSLSQAPLKSSPEKFSLCAVRENRAQQLKIKIKILHNPICLNDFEYNIIFLYRQSKEKNVIMEREEGK